MPTDLSQLARAYGKGKQFCYVLRAIRAHHSLYVTDLDRDLVSRPAPFMHARERGLDTRLIAT